MISGSTQRYSSNHQDDCVAGPPGYSGRDGPRGYPGLQGQKGSKGAKGEAQESWLFLDVINLHSLCQVVLGIKDKKDQEE